MAKVDGINKKTLDDITSNTDLAKIESMIEIDTTSDNNKKSSESDQMSMENLITVNSIESIVDEKMKVTQMNPQNDVVIGKYDDSEIVPNNMVLID